MRVTIAAHGRLPETSCLTMRLKSDLKAPLSTAFILHVIKEIRILYAEKDFALTLFIPTTLYI